MEAMFWEDLKNSREVIATEWIHRNLIRKILENTSYYFLAWF